MPLLMSRQPQPAYDARPPTDDPSRTRGSRPNAGVPLGGARWPLFVGLAVAIPVVDQIVKAWIVDNLELGRPVDIVGDAIRLVLVHNNGGLFGLFAGQAQVFAVVSLGVMALIVWYESHVGRSLLATLALGLLLGGAIGNLIDRLRYGFVVDFVDMGLGAWRWYTYNVADAAISTSILLLLLLAFLPERGGLSPASSGDADGVRAEDHPGRHDDGPIPDARHEGTEAGAPRPDHMRAVDNPAGD